MNLPRPMVLLLGAGATRAAFADDAIPPPIDADFFEIAGQITGRGTGALTKLVRHDVFDLYRRVEGVGVESYYRDIESRGEVGKFAKTRSRPKEWKARTYELEELIRRVLIHTTCSPDNQGVLRPRRSELHGTLLRHLKPKDTLITFNYDTVIEESMPTAGTCLWKPADGYGIETVGVTHTWARRWREERPLVVLPKRSQVKLLKLHGSLNWSRTYGTRYVTLKHRPYVVRRGAYENMAMIAPGWNKRVNVNPYKNIWKIARGVLEKCATLVVVGYSLPETDLIARALFLEVVRIRTASGGDLLKELHIADPSRTVKGRVVDLFRPALGESGIAYQYESAEELSKAWK